ncbi:MAG: selenocysteine-specific translation elongation factor [Deltaproteobacteria bacterium]|nr:selenocysteine-specific translation elongation factor [Deltaproteobacteria bacterium]
MRPLLLATSGHVDHGKTSLIKTLTGVDTDRLPEEKKRGMTLDLGFASFTLPSGRVCGVIDVPGHERFIKNMVSGAFSVDLALLVIAANEGIKPQTKEHLKILELFHIPNLIVVVSKADVATDLEREDRKKEIKSFLENSFFREAPLVFVSSLNKEGFENLLECIDRVRAQTRSLEKSFRMYVDRVFSLKGYGTVIAGSILEGKINKCDVIYLNNNKSPCRIRFLQSYGVERKEVLAGERVAINLRGIERKSMTRGTLVLTKPEAKETDVINVSLNILDNRKNEKMNTFQLHIHSNKTVCRITKKIVDKDNVFYRLKLDAPLYVYKGDRFILRNFDYSSQDGSVVGGGVVFDPHPILRVQNKTVLNKQRIPQEHNVVFNHAYLPQVEKHIFESQLKFLDRESLEKITSLDQKTLKEVLLNLEKNKKVLQIKSGVYIHADCFKKLGHKIMDAFQKHDSLSISQLKEIVGESRKYTIPLVEYCDRVMLTLRRSDKRILNPRFVDL